MKSLVHFMSLMIIGSLLAAALAVSFMASAEEGINHETDDNNTQQTANVLEVGTIMVGRLSDESDVDYFIIETFSTGDIKFHFDHQSDKIYNYYWYAEVTDEQNTVLNSGNLSGKEATDFSVESVKPGVYYLKISRASGGNPFMIGFSDAAYNITVSTKCLVHAELKDWEITLEPSCSADGERVQRCSACNEIIVTERIDDLDHSYNDWSIEEEAELLKLGKKKHTCVLCGETEDKIYMADASKKALLYGGVGIVGIFVLLLIIAGFAPAGSGVSTSNKSSKPSSVSNPAPVSKSDTGGYDYSRDSSGYDYYSTNAVSADDDDDTMRSPDGIIRIDGEYHDVYRYDSEGYTSAPYIEDAEGYKTYVDSDDVDPPFNWLDC